MCIRDSSASVQDPDHPEVSPFTDAVAASAYDGHNPLSTAAPGTEEGCDVPLVCLWLNCGHLFWAQEQLVQHIEQHVDQRCELSSLGGFTPGQRCVTN